VLFGDGERKLLTGEGFAFFNRKIIQGHLAAGDLNGAASPNIVVPNISDGTLNDLPGRAKWNHSGTVLSDARGRTPQGVPSRISICDGKGDIVVRKTKITMCWCCWRSRRSPEREGDFLLSLWERSGEGGAANSDPIMD